MSAGREPWPTKPYNGKGAVPADGANQGTPTSDDRCPSAAFEPQSTVGPSLNARAKAPTTNAPTTAPPSTTPPSTNAPSASEHRFPFNSFQIGTATISYPSPDPVTERRLDAIEASVTDLKAEFRRALRNNKRQSKKKKTSKDA